MFDSRDLSALPIAFSLTLWDAAPIYLSVGLALAILTRVVLKGQALHTAWHVRDLTGIEGLVYLAVFRPSLAPVLLLAGIVVSVVRAQGQADTALPPTPGASLRTRFGEMVGALLLPSLAAATIKVFAPGIPEDLVIQTVLALAGALLVGGRSGASAVPAVAFAVHAGGFIPAAIWIVGATARSVVLARFQAGRAIPTT